MSRFSLDSCATYPRLVNSIAGVEEKSLALSGPEAARLVLLNPNLFHTSHAGHSRSRFGPVQRQPTQLPPLNTSSPHSDFWPIRKSVLALIRNRAYPLWQRLLLLGNFCRQMDGIANGELHCSVSDFLRDFETSVGSGAARKTMNALPVNRSQQLDFVLRLAGLLLQTSVVHQRFSECIDLSPAASAMAHALPCRVWLSTTRWRTITITRRSSTVIPTSSKII